MVCLSAATMETVFRNLINYLWIKKNKQQNYLRSA